jgi:hypothetical protein
MPEHNDPLHEFEQKHGNIDTGRASYLMLKGALDEGATMFEAICATASYYFGMFLSIGADREDDEETPTS